jgi:hypothetical protein
MLGSSALLLVVSLFNGDASAALTTDVNLVNGIAVPNYDRISIGEAEALEGGAFTARTNNAMANWYNPAGLTRSEKSKLTASATAYEWLKLEDQGIGASAKSTTLSQFGTFVGAVIAEPLFSTDRMRAGFAIIKPTLWQFNINDAANIANGANTDRVNLISETSYSDWMPTFSWGYSPAGLDGTFRLGASFGIDFISLNQWTQVSDQLTSGGTSQLLNRSLRANGTYTALVFSVGAQWDVTDRIKMGLVVGAPGVSLGGSTSLTYEAISQTGGTTGDVYFRDASANFKNTVPLSAKYGISYEFSERAAVEVDAKFHNSVATYNLYSSDQPVTVTTTDATGAATTSTLSFPNITYKTLAVVNGAIGGHYRLNDLLNLHMGFFTSRTPVDDSENAVFRKVNLYAGILGVSFHSSHLSGSIGGQYQWGTTASYTRAGVLGGPPVSTQIGVRSFSFQYAISYGF